MLNLASAANETSTFASEVETLIKLIRQAQTKLPIAKELESYLTAVETCCHDVHLQTELWKELTKLTKTMPTFWSFTHPAREFSLKLRALLAKHPYQQLLALEHQFLFQMCEAKDSLLQTLQNEKTKLQDDYNLLKKQYLRASLKLTDEEVQALKTKAEKYALLETQYQTLLKQHDALIEDYQKAQDKNKELVNENEQLTQEKLKLEEQVQLLKEQHLQFLDEIQKLKQEQHDDKQKTEQTFDLFQKRLEGLQERFVSELQTERSERKNNEQSLNAEVGRLTQLIQTEQSQHQALKEQHETVSKAYSTLTEKHTRLENDYDVLRENYASLYEVFSKRSSTSFFKSTAPTKRLPSEKQSVCQQSSYYDLPHQQHHQ